jgi:hypothetical protein
MLPPKPKLYRAGAWIDNDIVPGKGSDMLPRFNKLGLVICLYAYSKLREPHPVTKTDHYAYKHLISRAMNEMRKSRAGGWE